MLKLAWNNSNVWEIFQKYCWCDFASVYKIPKIRCVFAIKIHNEMCIQTYIECKHIFQKSFAWKLARYFVCLMLIKSERKFKVTVTIGIHYLQYVYMYVYSPCWSVARLCIYTSCFLFIFNACFLPFCCSFRPNLFLARALTAPCTTPQ